MSALSVQLYTFRYQLEQDFDGTLARIAGLGLGSVEPFDLDKMARLLAAGLPRHGLTAPTSHADVLGGNQTAVFEAAASLGVETVIQPSVDPALWRRAEDVARTADQLSRAADRAVEYGLQVGYHNHHFELENRIDGRPALEVFADQLEPGLVLELDTYWAHCGGADVPALLGRLGERVIAVHLKDGNGTMDTMAQVPAGSGVMPMGDVLDAAPDALRVIEFDDFAGDIFGAVAASRDYLLAPR